MKDAKDVIPWRVTDISIRPYEGFWSMNPSIHFDGDLWRCVLRCCDYAMPDGTTIRSQKARAAGQLTKNAMVIFDPATWKPAKIYKMHEKDDHPRVACPNYGYEDMRIFWTDKGGLQGIAASLHLQRVAPNPLDKGTSRPATHQPPEQVLLSFDGDYHIVGARPIRGDSWSGSPQKNWVPFDRAAEPRFLYSIDKGTMFGESGSLHGASATAHPSSRTFATPFAQPSSVAAETAVEADDPDPRDKFREARDDEPAARSERRKKHPMVRSGSDVRVVRGGRMSLDASASRPSARPSSARTPVKPGFAHKGNDSTRLMGTGRVHLPKYEGLRGGSQLVRVGDEGWLGIAHEMKFVSGKKFYWHTWYLVDSRGKMKAASEAMKLVPAGIEFAAGLAIAGERVVVSFGVDDMECWIGETTLSAVMETLRSVDR